MDASGGNYIKGIIETLLFISEKPVMLNQIKEVIEGVDTGEIRDIITSLQKEYEERKSGIVILEIAGGYQMLTNSDYAMYIRKFYRTRHKEKLSKPALETLAIIAYKQPVSRNDIEIIRGVNSDGVVTHLVEKGLIKIAGRKDIPGRPYIYGTTKQFLEYFGLRSLVDLPKLEDFSSLQPSEESGDVESSGEEEAQKEPSSGDVAQEQMVRDDDVEEESSLEQEQESQESPDASQEVPQEKTN